MRAKQAGVCELSTAPDTHSKSPRRRVSVFRCRGLSVGLSAVEKVMAINERCPGLWKCLISLRNVCCVVKWYICIIADETKKIIKTSALTASLHK